MFIWKIITSSSSEIWIQLWSDIIFKWWTEQNILIILKWNADWIQVDVIIIFSDDGLTNNYTSDWLLMMIPTSSNSSQ